MGFSKVHHSKKKSLKFKYVLLFSTIRNIYSCDQYTFYEVGISEGSNSTYTVLTPQASPSLSISHLIFVSLKHNNNWDDTVGMQWSPFSCKLFLTLGYHLMVRCNFFCNFLLAFQLAVMSFVVDTAIF